MRRAVLLLAWLAPGCWNLEGFWASNCPLPPDPPAPRPAGTSVAPGVSRFVEASLHVPESQTERAALSFDLDGKANTHDNAFANASLFLGGSTCAGTGATFSAGIESGRVVTLFAIDNGAGAASWTILRGQPSTPPAFDGTDMLAVDSIDPASGMLTGTIDDGVFDGTAGGTGVPITLELTAGVSMPVTLFGAHLRARVSTTGCADPSATDPARLAGAIRDEDVHATLFPAYAAALTAIIARDCPGCSASSVCIRESGGEISRSLFDTNTDCTVTAVELEANQLFLAATNPDVDLFDQTGAFNPGADADHPDSLSIGLGIDCVPATFDLP